MATYQKLEEKPLAIALFVWDDSIIWLSMLVTKQSEPQAFFSTSFLAIVDETKDRHLIASHFLAYQLPPLEIDLQ